MRRLNLETELQICVRMEFHSVQEELSLQFTILEKDVLRLSWMRNSLEDQRYKDLVPTLEESSAFGITS